MDLLEQQQLKQKIKELNCLYNLSTAISEKGLTIEEIINRTITIIPTACLEPNLVSVRISWNGDSFQSKNFRETKWRMESLTMIEKKELRIELFHEEQRLYLPEEQSFLNEISQRLKMSIENRLVVENLENTLERSKRHEIEMNSLLEATKFIFKYSRFNDAARAIFDSCKKLIGAASGYVALLSEDGKQNELLFLDSGGLECTVDPTLPMPIRGLRAEAYKTAKAVYHNDFMNSKWQHLIPEGHVILNNVLFAPLNLEGKTIGIMGLANKKGGFTVKDLQLASAFSELAAISLYNSKILESLKQSEKNYYQAYNKSELLKNIFMHDMNNIIQNIKSSMELIEYFGKNEKLGKEIKKYLEIIDDQINRGMKLVTNIRKISLLEDRKQELYLINLNGILEKTIDYVKNSYVEQQVFIEVRKKELDCPKVLANELLSDVFENLLINAIKYNENTRKEIIINIERKKEKNQSWVIVEIIDNGMGIPDEIKAILFKEEVKRGYHRKGLGLGLILVKKIIDSYNGKIWIEDRFRGDHSKGSKFVLMLNSYD
ncbi:MAG: sensor histidine kinase [Promethearchaeota archaeon]